MRTNQEEIVDYTAIFDPIVNRDGRVRFINHSRNKESHVGISIDDNVLQYRIQQCFPSIIADLIDLAVAIHATDRLTFQNLRQEQTRICVVLPVRHPELFNAPLFQEKLKSLLEWATGSRWFFDFHMRTDSGRIVEEQYILSTEEPYVDEVALWSGGLDALAGIYTRLKEEHSRSFMLFGTGSNDNNYARQERVFKGVQTSFSGRLYLCRVPIRFSESSLHQKNKISRARGIVFILLGSACAYLMGHKALHLYENGIGAINLPYRKSAIGLDHSRSVHPLTLLKIGDVISEILGEKFNVYNPFLFSTKAEMCRSLAEDGRIDLPPLTLSCDSPHRQQPIQCGYCSSCILRKQALAASKLEDRTHYVVPDGQQPVGDTSLHLKHMLAQVSTLRSLFSISDDFSLQWRVLTQRFSDLDDIVDRTAMVEGVLPSDLQKQLIRLYQSYVSEWDAVELQISANLLDQKSDDNHAMTA